MVEFGRTSKPYSHPLALQGHVGSRSQASNTALCVAGENRSKLLSNLTSPRCIFCKVHGQGGGSVAARASSGPVKKMWTRMWAKE